MHADRLLRLAELLEADAHNPTGIKFDLGNWGVSDDYTSEPSISCGTSACAMGLAVLSGAFADVGLINGSSSKHRITPEMPSGCRGFTAAQELFGIQIVDSHHLFDPDHYPSEKLIGADAEIFVATRIREFVSDHEASS